MPIVRTSQVVTAEFFGQALEPQPSSVIQDPDTIVAVFQSRCTDDRALEDCFLLIVRADEDIDELNPRSSNSVYSSPYVGRTINRSAEKQHRQADGKQRGSLSQHERISDKRVGGKAGRWQRLRGAPHEVSDQQDYGHSGHQ